MHLLNAKNKSNAFGFYFKTKHITNLSAVGLPGLTGKNALWNISKVNEAGIAVSKNVWLFFSSKCFSFMTDVSNNFW